MTLTSLPQISFREWKYLDAHLVWIYEGEPRDSGKIRANSDHVTAWYVLEGSVEVDLGGVKAKAERGEWLLLPPGESDRCFSENVRILSVHFIARWVTGQQLFRLKKGLVLDSSATRGWLKLCRPMLRLVRRSYPDAYNQLPEAIADFDQYTNLHADFQCWLRRVFVALQAFGVEIYLPQTRDPRVMEMLIWLDALPLQNPFRMQAISAVFGLSATQVNRIFCADCGISPKKYFEARRLKFVEATLVATRQALKEISYQAGFRHQSEFTAWFKKHTGKSPSAFRAAQSRVG